MEIELDRLKRHPRTQRTQALALVVAATINRLTRRLTDTELQLAVQHWSEMDEEVFRELVDVPDVLDDAVNDVLISYDERVSMDDPYVSDLANQAWDLTLKTLKGCMNGKSES